MSTAAAWLISIVAAAMPTLVYVLILWWFDRYEKEPRRLLLAAFVWGALPATILSFLAESVLVPPLAVFGEVMAGYMSGSLLAPLVEELTKCLAVFLLFLLAKGEFDGVLDGIIYGATIGFGFAMTENTLYFVRSLRSGGLGALTVTVLMRTILFGMNHALFTSVFGAALGYARTLKQSRRRWVVPLLGLLGGMFLHGVHNLFAALSGVVFFSLLLSLISDWGGVLVILVVMLLAAQQEKRWIATHLQGEVASGLLTQEEYNMIGSYRKRLAEQWQARRRYGRTEAQRLRRLAQLATELAFKLEQGDERNAQKLRGQIVMMREAQAAVRER